MRTPESGAVSGKDLRVYDISELVKQVLEMFDLPYQMEGETAQVLADKAQASGPVNMNSKCIVSVRDRGTGISDEIKSSLFVEGLTHGNGAGIGLGSYIVKNVMDLWGDRSMCGTIFPGARYSIWGSDRHDSRDRSFLIHH